MAVNVRFYQNCQDAFYHCGINGMHMRGATIISNAGLEIKIFSREPNCIFISFLKVFCMSNNTYLGSLHIFEGAPGTFKGALGSRHPLISSPAMSHVNWFLLHAFELWKVLNTKQKGIK